METLALSPALTQAVSVLPWRLLSCTQHTERAQPGLSNPFQRRQDWPSQCFPLTPRVFHRRRRQEPRIPEGAHAPARARLSHTALTGQTQLSGCRRSTGWWVLQRPPLVPWLVVLLPAGEEGSRPLMWATTGTGREERSPLGAVLVSYSCLCALGWGQLGQKVSVPQSFVFCRP